MVTHIHKPARRRRLYLAEHRKAKGIRPGAMAGRLGIERESVHRIEREAMERANGTRQAEYADILEIEPEALWSPPGTPSLDAMVKAAPPEVQAMAADIVRRLVAGKG